MTTTLSADVKKAVKVGYKAAMDTPEVSRVMGGITFKSFKKRLKEWFVFGVEKDSKMIGMGMLNKGEIHFCIKPEYQGRWLTRGLLKQINSLDIRYTTVGTGNAEKQRFVEKIGFEPVKTEGENIIYQLNSLKHG